jgi:hypothetical protein
MASTNPSTSETGSHIILAGLILQIVIFGFFIVVALVFHLRVRAMPTSQSQNPTIPWQKYLYILYITCGLILLRSFVRVAEFVEGFEGNIIEHEVYLYVFDAVPMLAVMVVFSIWYPSNFSALARRKAMEDRESADSNVEL